MTSLSPSSPFYSYAVSRAANYGVPQDLFLAQIGAESGGNPNAYNASSGATGIAQFLPSTADNPGYGISSFDPADPYASIDAAAHYDSALFSKTGSWSGAMSAYSGASAGNTPYAGNADVQSALGGSSGGGLSWSNLFPSWTGGTGGSTGGGLIDLFNNPGSLFKNTGQAGGSISIIQVGKRVGLFVLAVVLIGVGVWALAKGDVGDRIDGAVKGLGRRLAS